jgi:gliding motility-associated protein GldM
MATGKLSPRQKMINLMYLVFIAMLALQVSKEVISAFGVLNERLEQSNLTTDTRNSTFMAGLDLKAEEQPDKYGKLKASAEEVKSLTDQFYQYLEGVKKEAKATVKDPTDYEVMDQTDFIDQKFFNGDVLKADGKEFLNQINSYRDGIVQSLSTLGSGYEELIRDVQSKFNVDQVKDRSGINIDYMKYHFNLQPLITSITKFSQMQNDAKNTEYQILSKMLEGELTEQISLKNFNTLLEQDRSAYYQGQTFDGRIVVGKIDRVSRPDRVELKLDGRDLREGDFTVEGGVIQLKVPAGNAGEHKITGTLFFQQDGEEVPVAVEQSYSVISKPNEAVISADKMNVVYRGVDNPITISMPGVPDNKIQASAPGMQRVNGTSYIMKPGTGREVTINVTGEIDGEKIPTSKQFRIKDIPRPTGTIRGEDGTVKMQRNSLEISTVGATIFDFDFDLKLNVNSFKFKVPGQPTIEVNGNKLDARAKSALSRAVRGDIIQIFDVNASLIGNSNYLLKKVSPVLIELTN